jgi:hypothetical protein
MNCPPYPVRSVTYRNGQVRADEVTEGDRVDFKGQPFRLSEINIIQVKIGFYYIHTITGVCVCVCVM